MTTAIRTLVLTATLALLFVAGCGQKKVDPTPEPDTKPAPIGDKAVAPPSDKDAKPPETPTPKTGTESPVLDAVQLTRELGKSSAIAERYEGKVVRIEGIVWKVLLKPNSTDPTTAEVTLRTAQDVEDLTLVFEADKANASKVGPWQKVIVQGSIKKYGSIVQLTKATIVKFGPVAFTQVELERIQKEEPKAVAELKNLGVSCVPDFRGFYVTLKNEDLTPEGVIKPAVLSLLSRLTKIYWLGLSGTRISDTGIKGLEKLIQVNMVEMNKCERIGVRGLVPMKVVRGLTNLYCNDTPLTDEGWIH